MDQTSQVTGNNFGHKLFFIGFNKTGTFSFNKLFIDHGYNSTHNPQWWLYRERTQFKGIQVFTDGSEAYSDNKFYPSFPDLNRLMYLYPDAKFVIQKRCLKKWLISRLEKHYRNNDDFFTWTENTQLSYLKHLYSVRIYWHNYLKYFLNIYPQNFLELYIDEECVISKLESFLNIRFNYSSLPHVNATKDKVKVGGKKTEVIVSKFLDLTPEQIEAL